MSKRGTDSSRVPHGRPARGAVERLFVYWMISTALLALIAIVLAIYTGRSLARAQELTARVAELERSVASLRPVSLRGPAPAEDSRATPEPSPAARRQTPARNDERELNDEDLVAGRPTILDSAEASSEPAEPAWPEADVRARVEALLVEHPATILAVSGRDAARDLVQQVQERAGRASWSGGTWAMLAVVGRLVERDAAASAFARRAEEDGDPLILYEEVSVRSLLARGRAAEALPFARRLVEHSGADPAALVLLADALWGVDQPVATVEVLRELGEFENLHVCDKLRLARLHLAFEQWRELSAVVNGIEGVPEELVGEYNFLYAVTLTFAERTVEALAVLDYLAAEPVPEQPPAGAPWPLPYPDRYEVLVWRGATLMYANQMEAAREALEQAAAVDPGRPEAYYRRGVLEAWAGNADAARDYVKNALASSARMVAAWEALASLELEANEVEPALEHLAKSIELNPFRASAHFLMGIAHAKLSDAAAAEAALRAAFRLDAGFLDEAREVEVLTRLFSPGELERMAADPNQAGGMGE